MITALATRRRVSRQIAHDLAAAGRVADVHRIFEIKMSGQRGQIVGVVIHVVAVTGLGRPAVPAAVVGDHAIAVRDKEQHLRVPVVGRGASRG
jgi:hypothetical protein